ncbi:hypothetical protein [Streptomyces sp. NPDC059631]|uniref:hypothetical protein n=1 Tax=unclassified Streptomyces TaxID=2593676 RepID=UPI0036CC57D9
MATIWVLTQPKDESKQRAVRADVITGVSGDKENVRAFRSDTQDVTFLVEWSTSFDKRDPLPAGFYLAFLQALDEAQRKTFKGTTPGDQVIKAEWSIDQQEWRWAVQDVEDLEPGKP